MLEACSSEHRSLLECRERARARGRGGPCAARGSCSRSSESCSKLLLDALRSESHDRERATLCNIDTPSRSSSIYARLYALLLPLERALRPPVGHVGRRWLVVALLGDLAQRDDNGVVGVSRVGREGVGADLGVGPGLRAGRAVEEGGWRRWRGGGSGRGSGRGRRRGSVPLERAVQDPHGEEHERDAPSPTSSPRSSTSRCLRARRRRSCPRCARGATCGPTVRAPPRARAQRCPPCSSTRRRRPSARARARARGVRDRGR